MSYYVRFWRGVDLRHPRLTRDWRRWRDYLCWWVSSNIQAQGPPPWWRLIPRWARRRWPGRGRYHHETAWGRWCAAWARGRTRLSRPFCRYVGEYGSRCDWTDKESGRLYGGEGGEINRAFDALLQRIEPTDERKAAVAFAVDDLHRHLTGEPPDDAVN